MRTRRSVVPTRLCMPWALQPVPSRGSEVTNRFHCELYCTQCTGGNRFSWAESQRPKSARVSSSRGHWTRSDRQQDKRDQRHARDAVSLETVGAGSNRVAGVVARAVCNHARIARVVFLDLEDDLHQVRTDVGNLREDAAGDSQRRSAE